MRFDAVEETANLTKKLEVLIYIKIALSLFEICLFFFHKHGHINLHQSSIQINVIILSSNLIYLTNLISSLTEFFSYPYLSGMRGLWDLIQQSTTQTFVSFSNDSFAYNQN